MVSANTVVQLQSLNLCQDTGTFRAEYDHETTPTSMAVIAAIEEIHGVNPLDFDQLYHAIDTEALDEILRATDAPRQPIAVSFLYEGHDVTVSSGGIIDILPPDDGDDARSERDVGSSRPDQPACSTREEFHSQLEGLLRRAHENDVDVRGGWVCRSRDGRSVWDVAISEVDGSDGSD